MNLMGIEMPLLLPYQQRSERSRTAMQLGFTLVELMVTIALVAILMGLAAPTFIESRRNAQLTSLANSVLSSINTARAEALKTGLQVYVVPMTNNNWATGWRVYVDVDADRAYSAAADRVLLEQPAFDPSITIDTTVGTGFDDNGAKYIMFNASGYPRRNNGAFNADSLGLSNSVGRRAIILNAVGRARVCKTGATGCTTAS